MKNLALFENFGSVNENEANLNGLAPIWLNNYLKGLLGYKMHTSEYGDAIITVDHTDTKNFTQSRHAKKDGLDITIIFMIDGIDVQFNWTWGQDEEDIKQMAKTKIHKDNIPAGIKWPEPGDGPEDYVSNVMDFVNEVEEYRLENED